MSATLKMNVPEARTTSSSIQTSVDQLRTELNNVKNRITSLVGSEWQSNAATQFQQEFQTWEQQLTTLLTSMDELRTRLEREIAEWEQVAERLG